MSLLACLFLVSVQETAPAEQRVEKSGAHFHVVCHLENESAAAQALESAEAVWPLLIEALDLEDRPPRMPLEVHLYPDVASYEAAEARLTEGAFRRNLAFSHHATKSAHVALQPPTSQEALRELGLPLLTARLIAHEASHVARFALVPNFADHPGWFTDGLSSSIDAAAMVALGCALAADEEPFTAKAALRCQALAAKNRIPRAGAVLADLTDDLEFYDRYSVRTLFYGFLRAKHPAELERAVAEVRRTGGGPGYGERLQKELDGIWNPSSLEKLDREFLRHVEGRKPRWDEVFRSLETHGEDFVQRAFEEVNAIAWRTEPVAKLPFTCEGWLRILPGRATQMNFLLGRSDAGFLSVAFTAGYGVDAFRYESASEEWHRLGTVGVPELRVGTGAAFRIVARADALTVSWDGKEVLQAPLDGVSPLGPWGLGAQNGSCGEWKKIRVVSGK